LTLGESLRNHVVQVQSTRTALVGVLSTDVVDMRALTAGGSASVRLLNPRFPLTIRLGVGALLAHTSDTRDATIADPTSGPYAASHFPLRATLTEERTSLAFVYAAPEIRQGVRLGEHFELSLGVAFYFLFATSDLSWQNVNTLSGAPGDGLFQSARYLGSTLVAYAPSLGLRYDIRAPF